MYAHHTIKEDDDGMQETQEKEMKCRIPGFDSFGGKCDVFDMWAHRIGRASAELPVTECAVEEQDIREWYKQRGKEMPVGQPITAEMIEANEEELIEAGFSV